MKQWIVTLFCVLLLAMSMTVGAAPTTKPEDPVISATTTDPRLTTTDPRPTTTEPSRVTDSTDEPTTTTKEKMRMQTSMSLSYADLVVTVKVVDVNGQPVRNAPLAIAADGALHSAQTNSSGVATLNLSVDPVEITASMAEFQGAVFLYEAAKASVVLQTAAPSVQDTTVSTTTRTTYTGTTKKLTTTDPVEGDVTQIVTVTGTTVIPAEEKEEPAAPTAFPRGLALGLIIFGAVLLLAAVLLTYFVLIRKPRDPAGETDDEQPAEMPAVPVAEESPKDVAAEEGAVAEDAPVADESADIYSDAPRGEGQVSLEDLFRSKGE